MNRKRYKWTPERDNFILENSGKIPHWQMAKSLGCSTSTVTKRIASLNPGKPKFKFWTPGKDAFMRKNYNKMTRKQVAEVMGCSVERVQKRAGHLGLTKREGHTSTPMEVALPPEGVELVRTAFRALVTIQRKHGKVDVAKFLQAWRERECGFRNGNNRNRRVAKDGLP